jgi:hypothetical protein
MIKKGKIKWINMIISYLCCRSGFYNSSMKIYLAILVLCVLQVLADYPQYPPPSYPPPEIPSSPFTCFGINGAIDGVCSGGGTCVGTNLCACFSGRAGVMCEIAAPMTCNIHPPPLPLVTNYPPFIDASSTFYMNDTLHLVVDLPIVKNRKAVVISIQNSLNPVCRYPGTFFTNTINTTGDCFNSYIANIPFVQGVNCGWNITNITDPATGIVTFTEFSGYVFVTYLEKIDAGEKKQVLRAVRSALPLALRFPIGINETNIPIIGPGEALSAISQVVFNLGHKQKEKKMFEEDVPNTPDSGTLSFVTALSVPFELDPASAITIQVPNGLTTSGVTLINSTSNCTSPTGPFCNQVWQVQLEIDFACSFSGTYIFNFTQICRPGAVGCSAVGLPPLQFVFTVDMADFCATISLNVPLNGFLQTARDANFTTPGLIFTRGSDVFVRAIVGSPQASISRTIVKRVSIMNNDTVVLYNRHITQAGSVSGFALIPTTVNNQAIFKFTLVNLPIPMGSTPLTINALINVQYTSISESGFMKTQSYDMMVVQDIPAHTAEQEIDFGTDITVADAVTPTAGGVMTTLSISLFLLILTSILL